VESFTDEIKRYFTSEQIADFEHESSTHGREKNKLDDLLKEITAAIKKGLEGEEPLIIEIAPTIGTVMLDKQRRQNDNFIDRGYEVEECEVFGIVNETEETMEYVTIEGELVKERTRGLSPKEKMKYLHVKQISMVPGQLAANG
jgi:hypothetical protein